MGLVLQIEPTTRCNLACPLCPVPRLRRPSGDMDLGDYRRLLAQVSRPVERLLLFNYGEPLLHPQLAAFVRTAERRGVPVEISTNAMLLDESCARALIAARLTRLVVCVDGASAATHERYRAGSRFETVVANIREFLKRRGRRRRPWVAMQSLMTRHNEEEWSHLVELAHELGVDEFRPKTLSLGRHSRGLDALAREWLPEDTRLRRYEWNQEQLVAREQRTSCVWAERCGVVLFNGDVTTCCRDAHGQQVVGNVFRGSMSYAQLMASPEWRDAQQRIRGQDFPLCRDCPRDGFHPRKVRFRRAGRGWWEALKGWWRRS